MKIITLFASSILATTIFASTLLLAGCSTAPKVFLASAPVEVTDATIYQYWTFKKTDISFEVPMEQPKKMEKGHVTIRYLIDSNGNVSDEKIIESVPAGNWDVAGVKALAQIAFVPAANNVARTPVYYTQTIMFE